MDIVEIVANDLDCQNIGAVTALQLLKRYGMHDLTCPEFRQKSNRYNGGMVVDTAMACTCGLNDVMGLLIGDSLAELRNPHNQRIIERLVG